MTEPMTPDRRAEISAALAAVPAPPWHWIGDTRTGPTLATKHSGWRYVMGFRRLGMNGAQPDFPVAVPPHGHTILMSAREQIISRTKYDEGTFRGIDNPVARFLADSAQYVAELLAENERLRGACADPDFTCLSGEYCDGCQKADQERTERERELERLRAEVERLRKALAEQEQVSAILDDYCMGYNP